MTTIRSRRSIGLAAALLLALVTLLGAAPAGAHEGDQTYLYLDVSRTAVGGRIESPLDDVATVLGLDLTGDDATVTAELAAEAAAISSYYEEHLFLTVDGATWPAEVAVGELFFSDLPETDDNYAIFPFEIVVPDGADVPRDFELTFDPFVDEIEGRDALLLIGNDWEGGVFDNGHEIFAAFDAGSRTQAVDLGDSGWWKTMQASVKLGVDHIKTGPDHVLFVLVLLLPSVLVFGSSWKPAPSFGNALWRVTKIVTMFTVAHSITFTLAGLDILPLPPSRLVESIIAGSIAVAALHNLRPVAANKEWVLSFAFGLFHGMGFASLVEGLDVPRSTQLLSLLGRNLGIEIGQAAVVVLCFPFLFLLARTRVYKPFFVAGSLALAAISVGWLIERVFDTDLGMGTITDPLVVWPRVLYILVALTIGAAALFWFERSNDRLVPPAPAPA
ncbi:MAG: HupE/UreJ family protein [Acidimicrobiales bacterium]